MTAALVLYVREDCALCEQFLLDLSLDFPEAAASVRLCDVDADPALALRFGLRVPVLSVAGRAVCEGRYDCDEVRRALGL
jgi:Glutaredoxin-like domain (DUF836)